MKKEKDIFSMDVTECFHYMIDQYDIGRQLSVRSSDMKEIRRDLRDILGYAKKIKDEYIDDLCADEDEYAYRMQLMCVILAQQNERNAVQVKHEAPISYKNTVKKAKRIREKDIETLVSDEELKKDVKNLKKSSEERKRRSDMIHKNKMPETPSTIYDIDEMLASDIQRMIEGGEGHVE